MLTTETTVIGVRLLVCRGSWDRKRLRCVLNGKLPDFAQHPNKTHVLDCLMKTMPLHFFETGGCPLCDWPGTGGQQLSIGGC